MIDYGRFRECDSQYRSAPFWSWNDRLDIPELIHQIREFNRQGIGGFFMHPRGGLADEYMGERFMSAVRACVDEAARLKMKAWLYDEDRWPSGAAAGRVTAADPAFKKKTLCKQEVDSGDYFRNEGDLRVFARRENGLAEDVSHLDETNIRALGEQLLVFRVEYAAPTRRWNNRSFPDLCCKKAVDKFIEETHQRYKEAFRGEFGSTIPGIFTDEPSFNAGKSALPWALGFDAAFRDKKGYDILQHLPELFYGAEGSKKVRFDYWDVISAMFVSAFSENIYRWCEENNLHLTGHYWEHGFPSPQHTGSTMPNYEFMQTPGIDMLFNTKKRGDQFGNDMIVKEVSSVANQLGKKRVLSETYGGSGWHLNFSDQKKIADWQFAQGINLVCQHLSLYSMRGYRKRDFPLSFLYHQPWWSCYRLMGDYIGRLSYALSQGRYAGDILVLHPSSSTWAEFEPGGENDRLDELASSFKLLVEQLCRYRFMFDLGDDVIIGRHGSVDGDRFVVGEMSYSTVVLGDMTVMRRSSFELLRRFASSGGRIVVTGTAPRLLDGEESAELMEFFAGDAVLRIEGSGEELKHTLEESGHRRIPVCGKDGGEPDTVYCHRRTCGEREVLFLCNTGDEPHNDVLLEMDGAYEVEEWDPFSGEREMLDIIRKEDGFFLELDFPTRGSHLLVFDKSRPGDGQCGRRVEKPAGIPQVEELSDWEVIREDYNALTINSCRAAVNGGRVRAEGNVVAVDDRLKDALDLERGSISATQPWAYSEKERNKTSGVEVAYLFSVAENLQGDIFVAAESPDVFELFINGTKVEPAGRHYKDRAFVMYDIKEHVTVGDNEVLMRTDRYGVLVNIESIYIVGDFRLERRDELFVIVNESGLPPGDWTRQGYPFYSGAMSYRSGFVLDDETPDRVELELDGFQGVAMKILVNGRETAILGWEPYVVDISDDIRQGDNEVVVQVVNSLQNLLGPHDSLEGFVTPGSFYSDKMTEFAPSGFSGRARVTVFPGG